MKFIKIVLALLVTGSFSTVFAAGSDFNCPHAKSIDRNSNNAYVSAVSEILKPNGDPVDLSNLDVYQARSSTNSNTNQ